MPALLTNDEAMAALRVSRNTFWKLKRLGYIKPVNENKLLERQRGALYSREDIERLRDEGLQQRKAS